ncbi:MAG: phosphate ABC transporter permease PstA [Candidatus Hadarchaeales archaeon]
MKSGKLSQTIAFWTARISIVIVLAFIGLLLFFIVVNGAGVMSWEFLTEYPREGMTKGGIFPAIVGTLLLVSLAVAIALPLGLMTALYLVEYAKRGRFVNLVISAIYNLNGVPSIVFGLFGLVFFVKFLGWGLSLISAASTLALMILPTIIMSSVEALKSVPDSFREGSMALGASKWKTIFKVVLPAAFPGIITGTMLGIGRAAGETAPILFTGAVFYTRGLPGSIFAPVMALPYHLFALNMEHPDIGAARPMAFGTALTLLILVLVMYLAASLIRRHYRKSKLW